MKPPDTAADALARCERYGSLDQFYGADARRLPSRELDVGLWWREHVDGPLHRAAWVRDTGELYLVRLGAPADGGGEVELLARALSRERMEAVLEGWHEQCGGPHSLSWLRRRLALMRCVRGGAATRSASAGSAPGRPRESAPRARPSRRTGGTAGGRPDRGRALPVAPQPADR